MNKIRDGDLYKQIKIENKIFEIRYGFYEEFEREKGEPVPIYPNFRAAPEFTDEGIPFVTAIQNVCGGFDGDDRELGCYGCSHYREGDDLIGLCHLESNRRKE